MRPQAVIIEMRMIIAGLASLAGAMVPHLAYAHPSESPLGKTIACAVIDQFDGGASILDDTRTHVFDIGQRRDIPCGGWLSVEQGWVQLHHRVGYRILVGPGTLIQFPEGSSAVGSNDPVVLFKGQVYGLTAGGMGELRMITPNGRARINRGAAVMLFDPSQEKSQLIAVEGASSLENRFVSSRPVALKPGQASSIDFELMRTLPSVARAVPAAALRAKLRELRVSTRDQEKVIAEAIERRQENFLPELPKSNETVGAHRDGDDDVKKDLKAIARREGVEKRLSDEAKRRKPASSAPQDPRAPESVADGVTLADEAGKTNLSEDEMLKRHMANRLVAGSREGLAILNPNAVYSGKVQKSRLKVQKVEDPASSLKKKAQLEEDAEKQRLIDELTNLKVE